MLGEEVLPTFLFVEISCQRHLFPAEAFNFKI
jgi:hypothetical protein